MWRWDFFLTVVKRSGYSKYSVLNRTTSIIASFSKPVAYFLKLKVPNSQSQGNIVGIISPFSGEMWLSLGKTREFHQGHFSQWWQESKNLGLHWETGTIHGAWEPHLSIELREADLKIKSIFLSIRRLLRHHWVALFLTFWNSRQSK